MSFKLHGDITGPVGPTTNLARYGEPLLSLANQIYCVIEDTFFTDDQLRAGGLASFTQGTAGGFEWSPTLFVNRCMGFFEVGLPIDELLKLMKTGLGAESGSGRQFSTAGGVPERCYFKFTDSYEIADRGAPRSFGNFQ